MRNPTHQAAGAASTLAVCAAVDCGPLATIVAVCASVLGSRLPDVDQPGARIHRRTRLERRSLLVRLAGRVLRLPMTIFASLAQHRGATHWLLSGAATTVVLAGAAGALSAAAPAARLHRRRLRLLRAPARRRMHTARRPAARPPQCLLHPPAATPDARDDRRRRRPARTDRGHAHRRHARPADPASDIARALTTRYRQSAVRQSAGIVELQNSASDTMRVSQQATWRPDAPSAPSVVNASAEESGGEGWR